MTAPAFLATDPQALLSSAVAKWEETTGKPLPPATPERLLINLFTFLSAVNRIDVQLACEKNLVKFAVGEALELLGDLVGVTRLQDVAATATERFSLADVSGTDTTIPSGTRVQTSDGKVIFATTFANTIPAGSLYVDAQVTAQTTGEAGNDYAPGTLTTLLDPIPGVSAVTNQTSSGGDGETRGIDVEEDEPLRERIRLAPSRFGTAGSRQAYAYWARSAGAWVADVYVTSSTPGQVDVYVLTNQGVPTGDQLDAIEAILSGETVRPISDTVVMHEAEEVDFSIEAELVKLDGFDQATIEDAIAANLTALVADRQASLGRDLTPDQVRAEILKVPGIYSLDLTEPAAILEAGPADFLNCTAVSVTVTASVEG